MQHNIRVRLARRDDVPEVIEMIEALAVFEKIYGEPKLSVDDMVQACGFDTIDNKSSIPDIVVLVAEDLARTPPTKNDDNRLVGYTILMHGYSARSGKILQMKNIFVRDTHRGSAGVGRELFRALAAYARAHGCRYEENHVLDWNRPAVNFYRRMGTIDLTESENWRYYRVLLTAQTNHEPSGH